MKLAITPVKIEAIVEAALSQVDKVGDGHRCLVCEQIDLDGSFTGFDGCDQRHKKFSKLGVGNQNELALYVTPVGDPAAIV